MKGLEKFKKEIKAEVDKVKDTKKKKLIEDEANEIMKHIESVCDEEYDNLLAQDHKSFERMWRYVTNKAEECAIDNCAIIRSDVVFGWIDEYVGLDDKAEIEKEKKKTKEASDNINKHIEKIKTETTKNKGVQMDIATLAQSNNNEAVQESIFDLF